MKNKQNVIHLMNLFFDLVSPKERIDEIFKEKIKNEVDCNFLEEDKDEEGKMNSRGFSLDNLEDEEDIEELIEKCDFQMSILTSLSALQNDYIILNNSKIISLNSSLIN